MNVRINEDGKMISYAKMKEVYELLKTPVRLGPVIREENGVWCDCPSIFRRDGVWYMMYVAISSVDSDRGYETFIASSEDLVNWKKLGRVLTRTKKGWDGNQVDGGLALINNEFGGDYALNSYDGRYWCSYIGGELPGYEPDPLNIGYANTDDPTVAKEWVRLEKPILTTADGDVRDFENRTIYRTYIFEDQSRTLGHRFLMYYNGKAKEHGKEQIGMCVSDDFYNWKRYLDRPVVSNIDIPGSCISGDPQIIKMDDIWVMAYFRFDSSSGSAYDTFACSEDLVNWTRWHGEPILKPGSGYDNVYAHKPYIVYSGGRVYHFYCACNTAGERFIALAVSE